MSHFAACPIRSRCFPRLGCEHAQAGSRIGPGLDPAAASWGWSVAPLGAAPVRGAAVALRAGGGGGGGGVSFDNPELLIGDCLCLTQFALYKQITALIFSPDFPGWLAPLEFSGQRCAEFVGFAATLMGTWVGVTALLGGYSYAATRDLRTALSRTCLAWLLSQPVAAAQLVLVMAAEGRSLVGAEGFADAMPLAASGPGEPFATAAGVLGLMSLWRSFYAAFLDPWAAGGGGDRERSAAQFVDALRAALLLALAFCALLQGLGSGLGEEALLEALGPRLLPFTLNPN